MFLFSSRTNQDASPGGLAKERWHRFAPLGISFCFSFFFFQLAQIAGVDYLYFIQKNTLNRRERMLRIEVHNETFSSRVIVRECCNYSVSLQGHRRRRQDVCVVGFSPAARRSLLSLKGSPEQQRRVHDGATRGSSIRPFAASIMK